MDKLYKDNEGNVYSFSPIQTPSDGLIELTPEEIKAHLKIEPTNEEKVERLKVEIRELELKQFRSMKAMLNKNVEKDDEKIYNEIEAEIVAKRQEIQRLA